VSCSHSRTTTSPESVRNAAMVACARTEVGAYRLAARRERAEGWCGGSVLRALKRNLDEWGFG
jgi:hypothetical protein